MSDAPIVSVSCGSDHAYFCGLWVTLHSLCAHASPEAALVLHVLDGGLDEADRRALATLPGRFPGRAIEVRLHPLDLSRFDGLPEWRGSRMTYARLTLQDLLADEAYTIYTDVDTLWLRDVCELWALRDEAPLRAAPDGSGLPAFSSGAGKARDFRALGVDIRPEDYFCAGILLMNLRALRERDFDALWQARLRRDAAALHFPDQDLYNILLPAPQTQPLDWRWGEFSAAYGLRETASPRVIHYANAAPWTHNCSAVRMLWWEWLADEAGFDALGAEAPRFRRAYARMRRRFRFWRGPLGAAARRLLGLVNARSAAKQRERYFPERRLAP